MNGTVVAVAFFGGMTDPVVAGPAGAAGVVLTATVVGQPGQTTTAEETGTAGAEEAGGAAGLVAGGPAGTTVVVTCPTGQLVTVGAQEVMV